MIKEIFYPTYQNVIIWLSAIYLLILLYSGKVTPITILFVYFLETILAGIFNVFKILSCAHHSKSKNYFIAVFFLFHYGFFVALQSVFAFALFDISEKSIFKDPFNIFDNYATILSFEGIQYAIAPMVFMYLKNFITDFIRHEKFLKFTPEEIMIKPYVRIFIQQFVVLLSFFFIIFNNTAGYVAATLLIVFRLVIDLTIHAIRENSQTLDVLAEKISTEKQSPEEIKKRLILFTE